MMKIYEIVICNNQPYEDNYERSYYFETMDEACKKYNRPTTIPSMTDETMDYLLEDYCGVHPTITLNMLELDTQNRTLLYQRELKDEHIEIWKQKRFEARMADEEIRNASIREGRNALEEERRNQTILGNIDALAALRDRLAGR